MSAPLQLAAQLAVVVDLAVLDDDDAAVLVGDRLVAMLEVDDREAACGQRDTVLVKETIAVRAAMDQAAVHFPHRIKVRDRAALGHSDAADPAHGRAVCQPQGDVPQLRGRYMGT